MVCRKLDKTQLGIYCWFFCAVIVLSSAGVVAWLSLTPRNPSFRISHALFPALDFKNHSTHSNASLPNNSLIFDLLISNPNKRMGIYYGGISVELNNGGRVVGTNSTIPAFYQGYENTTLFQVLIHASQEFWQTMNGTGIYFRIRVETTVMFRIIKWKTKLHQVAYEQQFNNVKINLNGTVSGGNYPEQLNLPKVKVRY